ncbi:ArsA family ATPase [Streptomyces sp. JJ66]|uniref:ArsA family ATPase n=1 Tax=Streptomyces sp. JJ66 TaxID=2803843 RepID=UPI001C560CDF|nr:ArsA-related P-loop ATPase [Streptomyces sp. JJ66]MBW1601656.1 ArsA family ATPase [Streptomyces sp. JJ66]
MRRTVLVTGAGGAGRTTVAAATALAAARAGHRTLLLSADPLAAAATADADGPRLVTAAPGPCSRAALLTLQQRGRAALDLLGAQPLEEDELTELPGAASFAVLHALHTAHAEPDGAWDVLVADLPPVPDAVHLLALPGQLARCLRRLLPPERQAARALRPLLAQLAGVPMPAEWLYDAAGRGQAVLAGIVRVLRAPGTSAHLVVTPEPGAPDAVRETRAGLALHGVPLDGVTVNRLLPAESPDPYLRGLGTAQREVVQTLRGGADTVPVRELPWRPEAPRTADGLRALDVPAPTTPGPAPGPYVEDHRAVDGLLVWRLPLPGATKARTELLRRGDEIIVTTGPYRRALPLEGALTRCTVAGARLADGELTVRFRPDPALWPRGR